jgi:4-hydroxybenzoate polyprenyltransferase
MLPLLTLMLYSLRWFPKDSDVARRLKEVFVIKNVVVSSTWAGSVTFLPILYFELPITSLSILIFLFFFFRFFINTVVFDLRDIPGDKRGGIHSMPVILGYMHTWNILQALNLLVGVSCIGGAMFNVLPAITWPFIFSMIYTFIYLTYLKAKRNLHFVCDVVVDGEYFALLTFYYLLGSLSLLP